MGIEPSGNPDPNFIGTVINSGSGQITAPGLNAIPELGTIALLGTGMAGLAGIAVIGRNVESSELLILPTLAAPIQSKRPVKAAWT